MLFLHCDDVVRKHFPRCYWCQQERNPSSLGSLFFLITLNRSGRYKNLAKIGLGVPSFLKGPILWASMFDCIITELCNTIFACWFWDIVKSQIVVSRISLQGPYFEHIICYLFVRFVKEKLRFTWEKARNYLKLAEPAKNAAIMLADRWPPKWASLNKDVDSYIEKYQFSAVVNSLKLLDFAPWKWT